MKKNKKKKGKVSSWLIWILIALYVIFPDLFVGPIDDIVVIIIGYFIDKKFGRGFRK